MKVELEPPLHEGGWKRKRILFPVLFSSEKKRENGMHLCDFLYAFLEKKEKPIHVLNSFWFPSEKGKCTT